MLMVLACFDFLYYSTLMVSKPTLRDIKINWKRVGSIYRP